MAGSNKATESSRRRFDIGSGISLELLDTSILEFVFHPRVAPELLGALDPTVYNSDPNDTSSIGISWSKNSLGIGMKGSTKEVVFLGASTKDKVAIRKILENLGGVNALISLPDESVSYEFISTKVQAAISSIGSLIKLSVAYGYNSPKKLKEDLVTGKVRMMAMQTVDTSQHKVVAFAYSVGQEINPFPPSHPASIPVQTVKTLNSKQYTGPFAEQEKLRDILMGGN